MPSVVDTFKRPLRDLRISVTDKCNFRCPYCMPIEVYGDDYRFAPKSSVLTFEEIERLARLFVRAGIEKIRLTGGEPLLRRGLPDLIARLAAVPGLQDLTLTTNGWFLPQMAADLKRAGLRRITVSVDSLDDAVFGRMNGRGYSVARVLEGIEAARAAGLAPVKVNCVVKRGENEADIVALARHFRPLGVIVRYIEYMDVGNRNGWRREDVVAAKDIVARIHAEFPLEPAEPNYRGEVAARYRYRDGSGEIGVISSITQPFCGDCSRARLSTNGQLITCLFADQGADLLGPLRAGAPDADLLEAIAATWRKRTDRYSEERDFLNDLRTRKIEMYQIGG
jgi:cyclic pyranopterin phosphate synthase